MRVIETHAKTKQFVNPNENAGRLNLIIFRKLVAKNKISQVANRIFKKFFRPRVSQEKPGE